MLKTSEPPPPTRSAAVVPVTLNVSPSPAPFTLAVVFDVIVPPWRFAVPPMPVSASPESMLRVTDWPAEFAVSAAVPDNVKSSPASTCMLPAVDCTVTPAAMVTSSSAVAASIAVMVTSPLPETSPFTDTAPAAVTETVPPDELIDVTAIESESWSSTLPVDAIAMESKSLSASLSTNVVPLVTFKFAT